MLQSELAIHKEQLASIHENHEKDLTRQKLDFLTQIEKLHQENSELIEDKNKLQDQTFAALS